MLDILPMTPPAWGIRKLELEVLVLSKCVNPECAAIFRYLHEGKVFRLERDIGDDSDRPARNFEYFWLCSSCARFLTVVYEQNVIQVRPSHWQLAPSSVRLTPVLARRIA